MKNEWQTRTLDDVCEFVGGGTPSKAVDRYWRGDIPWVSPKDMKFDTVSDSIDHISKEAIDGSATSLIPKNAVLMVVRSGILARTIPIATTGRPLAINQDLKALCPSREIETRFLYHLLSSKMDLLLSMVSRGATVHRLVTDQIRALEVALPPLPEQNRIVGILDEAFAGIATAKANAEMNLQNARALFESYLQSVFARAWRTSELVTLSDLASDITDGDHMPPPKSATGVPFITIGNIVKETRDIDFTNTFTVPHAYFKALKPYKKPKKGDVLYTVTGSFGIPVILRANLEFCFQRHIGLVRPKPETNSSWLYYLLLSPQVFKQANDGATGTAQRTVSLKLLRSYEVPRVSSEQQQAVVAKLDALSAETQRLASAYERKLAALEALKKSLLHQAFTGQL